MRSQEMSHNTSVAIINRRVNDRRAPPEISEEMIEKIAERAAEKAMEKMENVLYQRVGRTFVDKLLYLIGAIIVGLAYFLQSKGYFKF